MRVATIYIKHAKEGTCFLERASDPSGAKDGGRWVRGRSRNKDVERPSSGRKYVPSFASSVRVLPSHSLPCTTEFSQLPTPSHTNEHLNPVHVGDLPQTELSLCNSTIHMRKKRLSTLFQSTAPSSPIHTDWLICTACFRAFPQLCAYSHSPQEQPSSHSSSS